MAFIEVKNLSFSYNLADNVKKPVLKNLSFSIEKGQYVAILGHNGSGKSTLARLITMIEDFDDLTGEILIDGKNITDPDLSDEDVYELRRKVGMVFQNPDNQLVATIVEEDVAFGPENLGVQRDEIRRRVDWALETVGMSQYSRHEPHRLSGGQKQRVAIAGVIAMLPDCIIFDESTAMLDPLGRKEVLETIRMLNKEKGITVITITHYMDEALGADRIMVLNDGQLWMDGTPSEIFSNSFKMKLAGLELPQSAQLAERLKDCRYFDPKGVFTVDSCADAIISAYKKQNGEIL